ncbi:hypothetical protein HDU86_008341 [Geranomyces michiganensis]|nr:hypothetical protein HDU86_008341 [Geranomyces michiganensis]
MARYALGAPNSPERIQQTTVMWRRNYPDVQMQISSQRLPGEERYWKHWANSRSEGTSFMMASLHAAGTMVQGESDPLRQVLRQMAPPGVTDDSWMSDPIRRQAALDAKGVQMRAGLSPDHFSPENQRARALARFSRLRSDPLYQYTNVMQDREVSVWANGMIPLFWADPQTQVEHRIILRGPKSAIGVDDNDSRRFLAFLPAGIGLRNETGTYYATAKHSVMMEGILRQSQFARHEQGEIIQRMWRLERARLEPSVQLPSSVASLLPKGQPLPYRRVDTPSKTPPAENDALYLVRGWLDQVFPNGGYFHTGEDKWVFTLKPPDVDVPSLEIESLWPTWRVYMRSRPNHPYSDMLAGFQRSKADMTKLVAAVSYCRRIIADKRKQRHNEQCKWLHIAGRNGIGGAGPSGPSSASLPPGPSMPPPPPPPPAPPSAKKRPSSQHISPTKLKPWRY